GFLLLNQIPFINQNNNPFSIALNEPKNILHLPVKSPSGIDKKHANISVLNGTHTAHNRIELQILFYFGLTPYTGSIYQIKFKTKTAICRIYRITGRPGYICNNIAFLPYQCIYK